MMMVVIYLFIYQFKRQFVQVLGKHINLGFRSKVSNHTQQLGNFETILLWNAKSKLQSISFNIIEI